MATKSEAGFCSPRKAHNFDMSSRSKRLPLSLLATTFAVKKRRRADFEGSPVNKRRRADFEASGFGSSSKDETNFRNCRRVSNSDPVARFPRDGSGDNGKKLLPALEALQLKEQRLDIDLCKKRQCWVILMRLKTHPDGSTLKKPLIPEGSGSEVSGLSKSVSLDSIDSNLNKGLYLGTDEFTADIRVMFSNAMADYSPKNEIHKSAKQLSKLFEASWESLKKRWARETSKGKENSRKGVSENLPPLPEPSRKGVSENFPPLPEPSKEVKKGSVTENSKPFGPNESEGRKNCVVRSHETKTERFLDTLLASQQKLLNSLNFGCNTDLQRKKDREEARIVLDQTERTVYIDDSLKSFEELQLLCGHSLSYHNKANPLEGFGLFLKHEYNIADWDEEPLIDDWEEGEIVF